MISARQDRKVEIAKIKFIYSFFVVSMLVLATEAAFAGHCDQNLCISKVQKLYPHSNGNIYIQAQDDMSSLDCTLNQGLFIVLENGTARESEMYSILLASHMAEKEVTMRIVNGSSNCKLQYTQMNL